MLKWKAGTGSIQTRVLATGRQAISDLQWWLLPGVCVACGRSSGTRDLCADCARALPWNRNCCARCALPLGSGEVCGDCLLLPPGWQRARCPFVYSEPVAALVRRFKFRRHFASGRVLSELMGHWIAAAGDDLPDLLLPVPLHWRRRLRRQYNQAGIIAQHISARAGIPVLDLLRRDRPTRSQSGLDAATRRRNVRNAFSLRKAPPVGVKVAIVDDVLTTGSTISEIAALLQKNGVKRIEAWCLARAAA